MENFPDTSQDLFISKIYLFPRETPWILPTQFFVGKVRELGMRASLSLVENAELGEME